MLVLPMSCSKYVVLLLIPLCHCLLVEITLTDVNEPRTIKLVCGKPNEISDLKVKHTVLWEGSEFGNDEQEKLAEMMNSDALVPNILVNSTTHHYCYILANRDTYNSLTSQKKRVQRDSSASIPAENGICPPGYRIHIDRCFECFPGSYTSGQDAECFLCPKDFYMPKKTADSCWPCPEGKKTLAQGADSEEACVYFDEDGKPSNAEGPPWIVILSLVAVIIGLVWIVLIILLVRYWKTWNKSDVNTIERGVNTRSRVKEEEHPYESISDYSPSSSEEDHIYAEIGDYDDLYEVPLKPSQERMYTELIDNDRVRKVRPKKGRKLPSIPTPSRSLDSDLYLIPKGKSSGSISYEIPIQRSKISGRPIKKGRNDSEELYDDVQNPDEGDNISLSKSHSQGFEPEISTTSNINENKESATKDSKIRKPKSAEKMEHISEEEPENNPSGETLYDDVAETKSETSTENQEGK